MRPRDRDRSTLTNRLLLLSALIVVSTTLLLLVTSAAGVYDLAFSQHTARQDAYRDLFATEIGGRLGSAYNVLRVTAGEPALRDDAGQAIRLVLTGYTLDNAEYLEGLALIEADGTVLESWPANLLSDDGQVVEALMAEQPSTAPFLWRPGTADAEPGRLWAQTGVSAHDGGRRRLIGRVRTEFVPRTLADLGRVPGAPTALVLDSSGTVIFPAGTDIAAVTLEPDAEDPDVGTARTEGPQANAGVYALLREPRGLGWTIAIVEDPAIIMREALRALEPGAAGWVAALAVALVASIAMVTRVTKPLRRLEQRANALASGALIEPEAVTERDELGRVLEAFNHVAMRLNRLNEVAGLLAAASDRELLLSGINSSVTHLLGDVDAEILLLDEEGALRLVSAQGALEGQADVVVRRPAAAFVFEALDEARITEGTSGEDPAFFVMHGSDAMHGLAVPLSAGSDFIGVGVVVRHRPDPFSDNELETVRSFAAQVSVALRNTRLLDDERRIRRQAEALQAIAERAAAPSAIDDTLADIAQMHAGLLELRAPAIAVRDRAAFGLATADDPAVERAWLTVWDALADGRASGDPVFLAGEDAPDPVSAMIEGHGGRGVLLVPLERSTGVDGVLIGVVPADGAPPDTERLALARAVGSQASLALDNAFLFQQAKNRADNLETIFRISHAVGSSLQSRIVLNRVLDVVQKILSADAVMLMTYDAQRKMITVPMARGILHRDMLEATFRPGEDVPGRVFETREPERFDHIANADTRLLASASQQGLESLLAVPLLARGRSIGVLVVFSREASAFTTEELDLLRTFASQAALAIDNAEMFSREHQLSSTLQESILPSKLPRIAGIEAASVYLPAGTDADIGGDYYDLFRAPDDRVVISIGDVCGKGVSAATKTSMIRYALRGMVVAGLEPSRVLAELNTMLLETNDTTSIVTLWLGYLDIGRSRLLYADGGHPPGLLLKPASGAIGRLATTGALLGAVSDTTWGQREVDVEPGATLLLYTDGVTEARRGTRFFGEGRVRRALRAGGSPSAISQRLLAQVQRFAAGELRDDAAILALAYRPEAAADDVSAASPGGK